MAGLRSALLYRHKLLSAPQLKRLSDHKYSCSNVSLLDPVLQPWWCWLVQQVPLWLAPNLITIVGLIVNILTTLILVYYSPDARGEPPRWACALCALGLFIYQSLDSIDGKQARRTSSQSPLGELFDHGCDSISTVFVALSACITVRLGFFPKWMFFQCFSAMTLFYCAHWQTYVSGTLRFGRIDVTEAQVTIMIIHMVSAIFGPNIWMAQIFGDAQLWWSMSVATVVCGGWSLWQIVSVILAGGVGKNGSTVALPIFGQLLDVRTLPLYGAVAVSAMLAVNNCRVIFTGGCGKNGSTVAGTSVLSPIIPFAVVVLPAFIISEKSVDQVFETYPSLYVFAFGMVAAKVTNKLVIAHMTKSEMDYWDWGLLGPGFLFLNQYFNCFLPEHWVLWIALLWGTIDLLRYCSQVCLEICEHLHIELFRIPYPPPAIAPAAAAGASHPLNGSGSATPIGSSSASSTAAAAAAVTAASKRQTRSTKRVH